MKVQIATMIVVGAATLLSLAQEGPQVDVQETQHPSVKRLTPLLTVDAIEPSLAFFAERLGWTTTMSLPGDDGLVFASLERDGVEVMLQTSASVAADLGAGAAGVSMLYVEVDDLDLVIERISDAPGVEVAVPRRKTDYGADEIGVREPGGHLLVFAQFDG